MANIVFLNRYFFPDYSATSQLLSDLAFHLASAGHEICIITSRQRYDEPSALLPSSEVIRGVRVHRVWTSRFGRGNLFGRAFDYLSFYVCAGMRAVRIVGAGNVVVAMTDPPMLSLIAVPIARLKRAKSVNWIQDLFPEVAGAAGMTWAQGLAGRILSAVRDWSLRGANCNVVVCEEMAGYLASRHVSRQHVSVIPNWADGDAIRPMDAAGKNALRTAWGLADKFVVGYSGNMGRVHEFDTMLRAAEILRDDDGIAFLFIGGGGHRDGIETQAREQGLSNVHFRPYQPREKLAESLAVADIHLVSLLPAVEGYVFPSKIYGILAAGRPVFFVGRCDGEVARLIAQYQLGSAVGVGESEMLARHIRDWIAAPERIAQSGARARSIFEQEYSSKIALQRWANVLHEVMTRN